MVRDRLSRLFTIQSTWNAKHS